MKRIFAIVLFVVSMPVFAHGGEDHGEAPPPVSQNVAPRASTATDEFELVVMPDGAKLLIYLDRFSSNEPVAGAKIEVEGAGLKELATEVSPGLYSIPFAAKKPAKYPLTISVETDDTSDLLLLELDTTLPVTQLSHVPRWNEKLIWSIAALLALTGCRFNRCPTPPTN